MNIPQIKMTVTYDKRVPFEELVKINSSKEAAEVFRKVFDADTFIWQEQMILLCLNTVNKVIGFYKVSSGGMTGTVIDPRIIFSLALNCSATKIMLAHNHPSGNLNPSAADKTLTEKLVKAGVVLDIPLVDHLIITEESYFSFADEGYI